jgi:hypothetical protein
VVICSPLFPIFNINQTVSVMQKPLYFFCLLLSFFSFSQTKMKDTITRRANITYNQKANAVKFKPETPPLIPIAGAPKPSYSYLWEMGDGHYSKEAEPQHVYKNKGSYKTRLAVTNNYDNGKPPATRPKTVVVNEFSDEVYKDIASIESQNGLTIQKNCDPIPEQKIEVILSYQNLENYVTNGKLYLFFNEKQFKNNNFELDNFRTYAGEKEVKENSVAFVDDLENSDSYLASEIAIANTKKYRITAVEEDLATSLLNANKEYKNATVLEFNDANPGETRNVFFTLKTTPEMIKDTSATVTMRSIFVPNRSYKNHKIKNLEMEIVTSHDPNKMGSNGSFMNYRLVRFRRVNFKTRFQNNGEGPARKILLETDIPEMFDKKTFKIEDMYPKCAICPKDEEPTTSCLDTIIKKNQIHFTFKNIYLPGSTQKNVKEIDSTKGFVKYSMKFNKDFHKVKTKSRTAIIFDKNEPIMTNYATTRFKPGISIGAKAGYNLFSDQNNAKSYFVGATISPYKSHHLYWQIELMHNRFENEENPQQNTLKFEKLKTPFPQNNGTNIDAAFNQTTKSSNTNKNLIDIVPFSVRYSINNYIGIGAGPQFSVLLNQKSESNTIKKYYRPIFDATLPPEPGNEITELQEKASISTTIKAFEKMQTSFFGDVTFGFARIGPSFGARYVLNFEDNFNYFQLYGIWKF